jgi:diguanylate cyclase (GGDEF)-like protein
VYWVIVGTGVALTVVTVPFTVAFMVSAPAEFWILVLLALAADVRPVRLPPAMRRSTTFVVSVCFCFVILLFYGIAPAIVAETVAVGSSARRLHLSLRSWAYLTARLVCSFAAAGVVARLVHVSREDFVAPLGMGGVLDLALIAFTFVAVSCAINVAGAYSSGATRGEIAGQLRFEVLARGSLVVAGLTIASTPSPWALLLLFVPLVGWSQLARLLADRDTRLEHDPVTGLLSRHGLEAVMVNLPREHSSDRDWYGLILVQLSGMAYVSRDFGRGSAEHMMHETAERLRSAARPDDLLCRLSDSQFLILRSGLADETIVDGARRIVRTLAAPVELREGISFRLDPAAGVSVAPQHGNDLGQLIPGAEAAMFDGTAHGEVATVYVPHETSDVDDRLAMLGRLSAAVNDPERASEITMVFQPQVSITTGQLNSVEALLRWHDSDRGLVPTDELMRLVEPTGVMQDVTRHVLDRVVAQLAEWNRVGLRLRAAVNVSVLDLSADNFDEQVRETLRRYGIAPQQLDIEITERSMVNETTVLDDAAHRVARLGVGLSVDDFGTGFASIERLRRLPLSEVKIDRSYVSRIADSLPDLAIVTAIHGLAQGLGLRIVAEGVEDEATERVLAKLGGVTGQGWYYGRPMGAHRLVGWIHDRNNHR